MKIQKIIDYAIEEYNLTQHRKEITGLLSVLSQNKVGNFAEIGTRDGGTFYCFTQVTTGKCISIDLSSGRYGGIGKSNAIKRNRKLITDPNLESRFDVHFIEGDSHNFDTVKKLSQILGDEKLDFLFIDGDHTYMGVRKDYYIYKEFVKDGGLIAFHDIKSSDFHTREGCGVDILWNSLQNKVAIYKDDSDDMGFGNNIWGGIGIIQHRVSAPAKIFQVYYNQESMDCLDFSLTPYLNLSKDDYYENTVISNIAKDLKDGLFDCNFVGVTSWRLLEKARIDGSMLLNFIHSNMDKDVIIYSPDYSDLFPTGTPIDIWKLNEFGRYPIYQAADIINKSKVLKFDLFKKQWTYCFCNYWATKRDVFIRYVDEVLDPSIKVMNKNKKQFSKLLFKHRNKIENVCVFTLEGMIGSFLSNCMYNIVDMFQYQFKIKPMTIRQIEVKSIVKKHNTKEVSLDSILKSGKKK
jgi:predicted O-methyltransferase YrrM